MDAVEIIAVIGFVARAFLKVLEMVEDENPQEGAPNAPQRHTDETGDMIERLGRGLDALGEDNDRLREENRRLRQLVEGERRGC